MLTKRLTAYAIWDVSLIFSILLFFVSLSLTRAPVIHSWVYFSQHVTVWTLGISHLSSGECGRRPLWQVPARQIRTWGQEPTWLQQLLLLRRHYSVLWSKRPDRSERENCESIWGRGWAHVVIKGATFDSPTEIMEARRQRNYIVKLLNGKQYKTKNLPTWNSVSGDNFLQR